jgi:hypothetical protein
MPDSNVTPEQIAGEALFILKSLKDNGRAGRSNKLAEVKSTLEPSVTLEFDNYFFFLRKYHYIALDREACLQLTTEGDKVVEGEERDQFTDAVGEFFAPKLRPNRGRCRRLRRGCRRRSPHDKRWRWLRPSSQRERDERSLPVRSRRWSWVRRNLPPEPDERTPPRRNRHRRHRADRRSIFGT